MKLLSMRLTISKGTADAAVSGSPVYPMSVGGQVRTLSPKNSAKPRQINACITNNELRHRLLKLSNGLRIVTSMIKVAINQDLTKTQNKLAYEARQLVKTKQVKSNIRLGQKDLRYQFARPQTQDPQPERHEQHPSCWRTTNS